MTIQRPAEQTAPLSTCDMAAAAPDVIRSPVMARHPLTAAERTARVLRNNTNHPFCTPIPQGDLNTKRATGVFASV